MVSGKNWPITNSYVDLIEQELSFFFYFSFSIKTLWISCHILTRKHVERAAISFTKEHRNIASRAILLFPQQGTFIVRRTHVLWAPSLNIPVHIILLIHHQTILKCTGRYFIQAQTGCRITHCVCFFWLLLTFKIYIFYIFISEPLDLDTKHF